MSKFVHLHLHSMYSLLDGANRPKDICKQAKEWGMPAVAITDHGNMFGAIDFYQEAKKAGVKPIVGCEVYVANKTDEDKVGANHLILLAKDMTGYRNLMKLVSCGYLEGFYYKPRIDKELLAGHSEGLIGLSACLKGEIPQLLLKGDHDGALLCALEYKHIFKGDFYLELQVNGIREQDQVNMLMLPLSKKTGIPLIATSDCHYLKKEDARAHEALLCLQTGKTMDDDNRMRFSTNEFWFKSPEVMEQQFSFCPEALENTLKVAEKCNLELTFGEYHLPTYVVPEGYTAETYFEKIARDGFEKRLSIMDVDEKMYRERLESEIAMIKMMQFPGYMLIVWDFIKWAKDNGIAVGPGRGSAAGSMVAYAMGITDVDPLPYGLLFERFLNPDRISMPDIDVDFCRARRDEVIKYVRSKYGEDKVSQIITFGTMAARGAIRDVSRVLGVPYLDADKLAKLVPEELDITLEKAMEKEPRFKELVESDSNLRAVYDIAKSLEGITRHASKHAAGVVMAQTPMSEWTPLYKDSDGNITSQYDMICLEKIGLVKFDFLGIKTLDVIDGTVKTLKSTGRDIDISLIPLDDRETFELLASGKTLGVFQFESAGISELMVKYGPDKFEDLIAINALYRPGPLNSGMVSQFVDRKHGRETVTYMLPELEPILKNTWGVIVYQEQVMQIAVAVAGFTLAQADILRKAMGKKKPEEMAKQRVGFVEGSVKRGVAQETAEALFDLMAQFAAYGFNKCLHGDTIVIRSSGNQFAPKEVTIRELWEGQNSNTPWGEKLRFRGIDILQLDSDGRIRPGRLRKIYNNGYREVFEIKTQRGKNIKATYNHRLLTNTGYKTVEDLKINDILIVMGDKESYEKKGNQNDRAIGKSYIGKCVPSGSGNPAWIDGRHTMFLKAKEEVFVRSQGTCEECGIKGDVDGHDFEYAHLTTLEQNNEDYSQYHSKENLKYLCNSCHKKFDYTNGTRKKRWSKGLPSNEDIIISIQSIGICETFDIEMDTPEHNFIANGIVSHNSHSCAYALIAYQTAYLKAHYPAEFMAALLTTEANDTDGIVKYIADCKSLGLKVLPPDINKSDISFTVEDGDIRFGLVAVKNVGEGAIEAIIEARKTGLYTSTFDLCRRIDLRKVNKKVTEALVRCGAMDSLGKHRSILFASLEKASKGGTKAAKDRTVGQGSLFDIMVGSATAIEDPLQDKYEDLPEWTDKELLLGEREILGFYLSGHPLDRFADEIRRYSSSTIANLKDRFDGERATIVGMVTSRKDTITKKGDRMCLGTIEDMTGSMNIVVFPKAFNSYGDMIFIDAPLVMEGQLGIQENNISLKINSVRPLAEVRDAMVQRVEITVGINRTRGDFLLKLKEIIKTHAGPVPVTLKFARPNHDGSAAVLDIKAGKDFSIRPTEEFMEAVEQIYGSGSVVFL